MARQTSNVGLAIGLACVVLGMAGVSFAAVPLYRVFCQVTGFNGTPMIGTAAPGATARAIRVRFHADTNRGLPWHFAPQQTEVGVTLGEENAAFYVARNNAAEPVVGVSTYNVTPERAAPYFHKTACFCFNEQTLAPGQEMQFPLSFWVDPAIADDPATRDITTITLSYTFFRSLDDAQKSLEASQ